MASASRRASPRSSSSSKQSNPPRWLRHRFLRLRQGGHISSIDFFDISWLRQAIFCQISSNFLRFLPRSSLPSHPIRPLRRPSSPSHPTRPLRSVSSACLKPCSGTSSLGLSQTSSRRPALMLRYEQAQCGLIGCSVHSATVLCLNTVIHD